VAGFGISGVEPLSYVIVELFNVISFYKTSLILHVDKSQPFEFQKKKQLKAA
jgi:hypothetical protein